MTKLLMKSAGLQIQHSGKSFTVVDDKPTDTTDSNTDDSDSNTDEP